MSQVCEQLWSTLLSLGCESLSSEESLTLARWLDSQRLQDVGELAPKGQQQADHLLNWSMALLDSEQAKLAAVPARLALQAWDTLDKSSVRHTIALIAAAEAALRGWSVLVPRVPEDLEALMARTSELSAEAIENAEEVFFPLCRYAMLLPERRCADHAVAAFRLVLRLLDRLPQETAATHAAVREELAVLLLGRDDDEAERLVRAAIEIRNSGNADVRAGLWRAWLVLATGLWRREDWQGAERAHAAAEETARATFGEKSEPLRACSQRFAEFRRDWLWAREQGRLFSWALRDVHGDPYSRAVTALLKVAEVVNDPDDNDMMVAHAARLLVRGGSIGSALDLADARLGAPRAHWDGAGVYSDAVDELLSAGDRAAARDVLSRGFAVAARIAVYEGSGEDAAQRDLIEQLDALDHLGVAELARDALPAERLNVIIERDLQHAAERHDLPAVHRALAEWDWQQGAPDSWLLRDVGCVAGWLGDTALSQHMAERLLASNDRYLAVSVLLAANLEPEADALLLQLEPGWKRANALAAVARHAGERGDRDRFDQAAGQVVAELGAERSFSGSMALGVVARGAGAFMSRAEAEAWAAARLPEEARGSFYRQLDVPAPSPELPEMMSAIAARDWAGALAELRSVGNGYIDLVHAEMLAEPAAAAGREDVVAAALRFALARLPGPFADDGLRTLTKEEFRFGTARRLGMDAHRLMNPSARAALAEEALRQAGELADMPSAAALVIAAGLACRPHTKPD
jgi:hypothetical protein